MPLDIKSKLAVDVFKVDAQSHIVVNQALCVEKCKSRYCTYVCPAQVYTLGADGLIHVEHDGCLECGTCTIVCRNGALQWGYPRAAQGVQYRFG